MEGVKLKGHLLMSERERERMKVLARVKKGEMKLVEAADLLKLSYRHVKRVYGRYREQGDQGLIHQARGRSSNRGIRKEFKEEIIELYRKRYPALTQHWPLRSWPSKDMSSITRHCGAGS